MPGKTPTRAYLQCVFLPGLKILRHKNESKPAYKHVQKMSNQIADDNENIALDKCIEKKGEITFGDDSSDL